MVCITVCASPSMHLVFHGTSAGRADGNAKLLRKLLNETRQQRPSAHSRRPAYDDDAWRIACQLGTSDQGTACQSTWGIEHLSCRRSCQSNAADGDEGTIIYRSRHAYVCCNPGFTSWSASAYLTCRRAACAESGQAVFQSVKQEAAIHPGARQSVQKILLGPAGQHLQRRNLRRQPRRGAARQAPSGE